MLCHAAVSKILSGTAELKIKNRQEELVPVSMCATIFLSEKMRELTVVKFFFFVNDETS